MVTPYSPYCREQLFPETRLPVYEVLGNSEAQRAACCFCLRTTKTGQCACRTTLSDTLPISALLTPARPRLPITIRPAPISRSEEHTSELQSRQYLVCRLLLEKKQYSIQ